MVQCTTKILLYNDIFKTAEKQVQKDTITNFNENDYDTCLTNIIDYINKVNNENIAQDVFETEFIFRKNNWEICLYRCYNPFHNFILKFHNDQGYSVIFYSKNKKEKYFKGSLVHDVIDIDSQILKFGIDIFNNISNNTKDTQKIFFDYSLDSIKI